MGEKCRKLRRSFLPNRRSIGVDSNPGAAKGAALAARAQRKRATIPGTGKSVVAFHPDAENHEILSAFVSRRRRMWEIEEFPRPSRGIAGRRVEYYRVCSNNFMVILSDRVSPIKYGCPQMSVVLPPLAQFKATQSMIGKRSSDCFDTHPN